MRSSKTGWGGGGKSGRKAASPSAVSLSLEGKGRCEHVKPSWKESRDAAANIWGGGKCRGSLAEKCEMENIWAN